MEQEEGSLAMEPYGGLQSSWVAEAPIAEIVEEVGTPVFIYSADALRANIERVHDAFVSVGLRERARLYVPFFPNSNPHILQPLQEHGVGLLAQIPAEYEYAKTHGFTDFIVSPGHISNEEIAYWTGSRLPLFLGSLSEIRSALEAGTREVCVRIDSLNSGKPGIKRDELGQLRSLVDACGATVSSLEVYCGSGNSHAEMVEAIDALMSIYANHFPEAASLNFAGGFGFNYEPWEPERKHFGWEAYSKALAERAAAHEIPEHVQFWFEPARDLLADIGILVLGVKREIITNAVHSLIATDGSRMLMPSAQLRDRHHNVAFLDSHFSELPPGPDSVLASVRGRTILRNDYILPRDYPVPPDVCDGCSLIIFDVGAYCATQHMEFLNVPPAAEVLHDKAAGTISVVTERGDHFDKWRNVLATPKLLGQKEPA
ncbi:diaminopimelate decarboxylase [Kocuria indica]|uniref:Diaminopimelate decarboxylase n=1 Tax=Kocuria marina subsp. indica TaxID=1049583 RepID=A0A6N9R0X9_9MICC|nr:diaminopimelate decarboxylase [Kocuria indica]NDO79155.1 diaminopimelate decarboxylase [Kocuria indica]